MYKFPFIFGTYFIQGVPVLIQEAFVAERISKNNETVPVNFKISTPSNIESEIYKKKSLSKTRRLIDFIQIWRHFHKNIRAVRTLRKYLKQGVYEHITL